MRESLGLIGEELRDFSFHCLDEYGLDTTDMRDPWSGEEWSGFGGPEEIIAANRRCQSAIHDINTVLTTCLQSSTKLESLSLTIDSSWRYGSYYLEGIEQVEFSLKNLGPTLRSRTWEKLRHARLDGLRVSILILGFLCGICHNRTLCHSTSRVWF